MVQERNRTDPNLQSKGLRFDQLRNADLHIDRCGKVDNITKPGAKDVKKTVGKVSLTGPVTDHV